jgi:hypothetical protein
MTSVLDHRDPPIGDNAPAADAPAAGVTPADSVSTSPGRTNESALITCT